MNYELLQAVVYMANVLHGLFKMAVAGGALAHVLNRSTYIYITQSWTQSWEGTYSEVGTKKVPQNSVSRIMIDPSSFCLENTY